MKKTFALIAVILGTISSTTAQIKVGSNPTSINSNSVLELESASKGLLMPRVSLTSTSSFAPLTAHVAGMTVYNTATAGTGATAVVPGYYYNDGAQWVQTLNQATALKLEPWYNVATTSPATSNTQNIYQLGNVGIGTPAPGVLLDVAKNNGVSEDALLRIRNTSPVATGNTAFIGFNSYNGGGATWGIGSTQNGTGTVDSNFDILYSSGGSYLKRMTIIPNGNVGIGTVTPQKTLHVVGDLQVTKELNVGGNASTAGSAGTTGQILMSAGSGVAPSWQNFNTVSGTIASTNYVQGTTAVTVNTGDTADVPGVTITLTVPAGRQQTFLFNILGYALQFNGSTTQGVFSLLQNGVKISSAYASKAGSFPGSGSGTTLVNMPVPVTFLKSVSLSAGTYTFKVQYTAWAGNATVNYVPLTYGGYNGDTESMLTKMQVLVYNNP
ncbi:hypothetical protein [Flavobacterium sp.]|uniref:hypothetical protein n=1 Tax=Flavobacterium sp. TaxID=239 RepID=UPI003D108E3E